MRQELNVQQELNMGGGIQCEAEISEEAGHHVKQKFNKSQEINAKQD